MEHALNKAAFWRRDERRLEVRDGMDDVALALTADAWSRTGLVQVEASAPGSVRLQSGIRLRARPVTAAALPVRRGRKPMGQLDRTLCQIGQRFGRERREWVAMELEYADAGRNCGPD